MAKPKLRFKRPDGTAYPDWATVQLADIATRVTRKNKDDETDVPLTIASIEGLVDQRTYFGKTVASKDMSGYFLLKNGEFAYNKSYSVGYDYGAIKRLDKYDQGALSTLYICFALNDPSWSDFMVQYFDSLKWNAEMPKICAEGARNHGLLNVAPADFFKISMALPTDPEERDRIVEGLQSITERIECQASRVAALETQKKELLRQVFAREIRFKDESGQDYPEWEERKFGDLINLLSGQDFSPDCYNEIGDGIPYMTGASCIVDGHTVVNRWTVTPKTIAHKGDILIVCKGNGYGKVVVLEQDEAHIARQFMAVRPKELLSPEFCYHLIQSVIEQIKSDARGLIVGITRDSVERQIVNVPSLPEQQRIANFFTALDAQIENERALLEDWRQLKKGLLQQMFV